MTLEISPRSTILCMGITPCLQRTIFFEALRPGQVNRAREVMVTPSGKATNVARVIQSLGGAAELISVCGGPTGEQFRRQMQADGVMFDPVETSNPMRICQTLIDQGTGQVTELVEESSPLTPSEIESLFEKLEAALNQAQWLVISGSPPPQSPVTLYHDFVQLAQEAGCCVILDSQKQPLLEALAARPWLVKLNQEELGLTIGQDLHNNTETTVAAQELLARGAQNVVVTQGPDKVWLVNREGIQSFDPPQIDPVNPIGSGDAMSAGIALGLSRGDSLEDALKLGMACGAANALSLTSGVVDPDVLEKLHA